MDGGVVDALTGWSAGLGLLVCFGSAGALIFIDRLRPSHILLRHGDGVVGGRWGEEGVSNERVGN
jgi:hypothetical protein